MCNVRFMFEIFIYLFIFVCCLTPTKQKRRILKQKKEVTKKKLEIHLFQEKKERIVASQGIYLYFYLCVTCVGVEPEAHMSN